MTSTQEIYSVIPAPILKDLFSTFKLDIKGGTHGFAHWARVIDNGLLLAKTNHANRKVIIAFGLFHDICRENDKVDPEHGARGAALMLKMRNLINLTPDEIATAAIACIGHTNGQVDRANVTIGTCWDADRLDLWRVGVFPSTEFMSNEISEPLLDEASDRAEAKHMSEWAIELAADLHLEL
ncbi:hypothetical protein NVP1081O_170 [Vibrio phage 1.081.O._10N.286.52.C2]|nr:hypothetical protein NVP1081O_170 [Vibrio phage 1.081.O._10N.286.52.C2]